MPFCMPFQWNHITNEMILTTLPLHRRAGWWVGVGSNTKCVQAPWRGFDLHLWYSQPGTLYLFVHLSYENTHQHFAFFTFILFHMKYTLSISYEICTHLAGLCIQWVKPFYFSEHFIWNFILISSCLISIYLFELTQQYFVRAGGVLMFGGSLLEGLCSLFWRRFSVIFGTRQFSCFFICGLCLIFVFVWSGLASILD